MSRCVCRATLRTGSGSARSHNHLPDGQITSRVTKTVQPFREKYSALFLTQITCLLTPSRAHQEGRFAIVTNVGRGERWTRELRLTSVAEAYGEVVWS